MSASRQTLLNCPLAHSWARPPVLGQATSAWLSVDSGHSRDPHSSEGLGLRDLGNLHLWE